MENIEEVFNEMLVYDVDEALKFSEEGFKSTGNPEFLIYTAHGYLVKGCYEDAIVAVDLAFELGCDYYIYGYNVKGEAFLELGLYVESRRCFEKAISEESEQYLATSFLIELDIREEHYEDAVNRCIDYIENYGYDNKQVGELKNVIGWTYLIDLKNPEIAKKAFLEAIESYEECARAYTGLGVYEVYCKNYHEAATYFNKSILINSNDGENYFGLAICSKELKNFDVVEDYLVQANALEPEDERIIEEYAFELLRQDRREEAIIYFKEILQCNPENYEIKSLLREIEEEI